jgi:formylglycine-generating enzyme required for sulfatase activity
MAGNVFQWTATPGDGDEVVIKGSAWKAYAGIGRGAFADKRPRTARYVLVGFRCAGDAK